VTFLYCLALAQRATGAQIHAVCVLSNHYHLIATDPKALLPRFAYILNKFVASTGADNRFYVRAFIHTRPTNTDCFTLPWDQRQLLVRTGACLRRYGMTNPIWAFKPHVGAPWSDKLGSTGSDDSRHVAMDNDGNTYTASHFYGTIRVGTRTLTAAGSRDTYVAKFDRTGTLVWVRQIMGTGYKSAEAISVNNQGRVALVGYLSGNMKIGTSNYNSNGGDAYVVTFSASNGATQWWNVVGGSNTQVGRAVTFAPNGTVYVAGNFRGQVGDGWWTQNSEGGYDCFLASFSSSGSMSWVRNVGGGTGECYPTDIAANDANDALITGYYYGQVVLDPWNNRTDSTHTTANGPDAFVSAFGTNLQYKWHTVVWTPWHRSYVNSIDVDSQNRIYLAGAADGYVYVDDGNASYATYAGYAGNDFQAYVLELSTDGSFTEGPPRFYGGTGQDYAYSIDVTADGRYA